MPGFLGDTFGQNAGQYGTYLYTIIKDGDEGAVILHKFRLCLHDKGRTDGAGDRFTCQRQKPQRFKCMEDARNQMPNGRTIVKRSASDHELIVETWV